MDPSKPGKGILASLEHKAAETPRRPTLSAPAPPRGASLVVGAGVLIGALLVWWLTSGPSPVLVQESLPRGVQAAALPEPVAYAEEAAAIIEDAPAITPAPSRAAPALAAVLAPAPIASVVMRHERVAVARAHPKPAPAQKAKAKPVAASREPVRRAPHAAADTDVTLLSALVAHATERDVVEARSGDSTESLLQRCRRVGGEEGRLCRIRICSTRAGDDSCRIE